MAQDTTQSSSSSNNWLGNLINIASLIYGAHKANEPPQFSIAPETPNEQWKSDALKSLFNYSSGFADQYLRGISNLNPDYKLNTDQVGNPAFMGGIKVPTFDMSKLSLPTAGGSAQKPVTGGGTDTPSVGDVYGDPFGHISAPAGSQGDPFGSFPDTSQNAKNVTWDDIKALGPAAFNLASALLGAGMPWATMASKVMSIFKGKQPDSNTVNASSKTYKPNLQDPNKPTAQQYGGAEAQNAFNYNLMNAPGQIAPGMTVVRGVNDPSMLGMADLTPGFGYGYTYNSFYGGGGQSDALPGDMFSGARKKYV